MSFWRQLTRGIRVLMNREAAERDVDDEVQHYLEEATAALVAQGLSPDAARRAARLEVGHATAVKEQVRDYGWENTIGAMSRGRAVRRPDAAKEPDLHDRRRARHLAWKRRGHDDLQRDERARAPSAAGRRPMPVVWSTSSRSPRR